MRVDVVSIILTIGFIAGFTQAPKPKALLAIPIPMHISQVVYTSPLTIENFNQSVLGAQTIDPVDFVNEINKVRVQSGATPLRLSTTLMRAAKMRAEVIRKYQNFSHQDPNENIELGTVLPKLNYHFTYASENIGMGGVSAPDFVNGFMHSTAHKANLLDPRLTDTGAAIVDGAYKQYYVNYAVQLFAIPAGREEYLGYTAQDKELYEAALSSVKANLHPLVRFTRFIRTNFTYAQKYNKRLEKQKIILETILAKIHTSEPFTNTNVTMILEYNLLISQT